MENNHSFVLNVFKKVDAQSSISEIYVQLGVVARAFTLFLFATSEMFIGNSSKKGLNLQNSNLFFLYDRKSIFPGTNFEYFCR